MDDFLHNLRSGKLKQPDRSSRPYSDQNYKNVQRRNMMDRRKREYANKESFERMEAIKEILENLSESQRRMADAYEARTRAEERKARAIEILAQNLYRMLNPDAEDVENLFSNPFSSLQQEADYADETVDAGNILADEDKDQDSPVESEPETDIDTSNGQAERLNGSNRQELIKLISKMREDGSSWEFIAREIADKGYPTVSGRGTWRGTMVKNFFEKMESE